jgi:hypothetical protein
MPKREGLFARRPGEVPNWMAIRDEDNKRRQKNQARLRAARLARDASQSLEENTTDSPRRTRPVKK